MKLVKKMLRKRRKKDSFEDYIDIDWLFVTNLQKSINFQIAESEDYKHFEDIHAWIQKQREEIFTEYNKKYLNNIDSDERFDNYPKESYDNFKYFKRRDNDNIYCKNVNNNHLDYVEIDTLSFSFMNTPL